MSKYRFAVLHTGRPFGAERLTGWTEYSRHTSLAAAEKACGDYHVEMRQRCGTGWDDHFAIVPLRDTTATFEYNCLGWFNATQQHRAEPCATLAFTTITLPWPAHTFRPATPTPPGWAATWQCPQCATLEQKNDGIQEERARQDWIAAGKPD